MSARFMGTTILAVLGGTVLEKKVLMEAVPALYQDSNVLPGIPRAFGLVPLILTGFSFWMLSFGFKVGKARKECREKAEKDGEKDLDQYSLPNLYASGSSVHAKQFNATQRAHQHVLESIAQVYFAALFSAVCYPITAALFTLLWAYARTVWSNAYAKQGAESRYSHPMSMHIWSGLLALLMLSFLSAANFIFGTLY
eukprot:CAMPEP_0198300040 /NCGR_PEP_ID=MMETSP1449-20131203/46639_1 /TAXON_ID=420275 /ORGANISM="Attheya septentrionalis, Strain CCMP2084" /LENGTH=196 /DNA_ID=CAMNT_0044001745 /DNA_START=78 /DNA_END=668 /DNA_ORIENTATION=+